MDEVEKFAAFMLEQEVSSRVVQVARQQKLTKNTIRYMRESDLEKLFPALGDQLQFRPIMEMLKVSSPPPHIIAHYIMNMTCGHACLDCSKLQVVSSYFSCHAVTCRYS